MLMWCSDQYRKLLCKNDKNCEKDALSEINTKMIVASGKIGWGYDGIVLVCSK